MRFSLLAIALIASTGFLFSQEEEQLPDTLYNSDYLHLPAYSFMKVGSSLFYPTHIEKGYSTPGPAVAVGVVGTHFDQAGLFLQFGLTMMGFSTSDYLKDLIDEGSLPVGTYSVKNWQLNSAVYAVGGINIRVPVKEGQLNLIFAGGISSLKLPDYEFTHVNPGTTPDDKYILTNKVNQPGGAFLSSLNYRHKTNHRYLIMEASYQHFSSKVFHQLFWPDVFEEQKWKKVSGGLVLSFGFTLSKHTEHEDQ